MNLRHQKPLHAYKFPIYGKGFVKKSKKIKEEQKDQPIITSNVLEKSQEQKIADAQKISQRHIKRHAKMLVNFIYRVNQMYKQRQNDSTAKQQKLMNVKNKKKKKNEVSQVQQSKNKRKSKKYNQKTKIIIKKKKKGKITKKKQKATQKKTKKPRQTKSTKFIILLNKQNIELKTQEINQPCDGKPQKGQQQTFNAKKLLQPIQNNQKINQDIKNSEEQQLVLLYDCQNVKNQKTIKQIEQQNLTFTFQSKDYDNYSFESSCISEEDLNEQQKSAMRQIEQSFSSVSLSLSL